MAASGLERPKSLVDEVVGIPLPLVRLLHALAHIADHEHCVPAQKLSQARECLMVHVLGQVRIEFPEGPVLAQPVEMGEIAFQRALLSV